MHRKGGVIKLTKLTWKRIHEEMVSMYKAGLSCAEIALSFGHPKIDTEYVVKRLKHLMN